jgi:hypothetical protein
MRRPLLLVATAALLLGACGNDRGDNSTGASETDAPAVTEAHSATLGDESAPEALRFVVPKVGGGSLDMSQYAGQTVALWFWAPT